MSKLLVLAFGGNALLRSGQEGTAAQQMENVRQTCLKLLPFLEKGYNIIIGHGNGPQVGNVLLQHEAGFKNSQVPKMPLDVCVSETQGFIGYMIEQQLRNILKERGIQRKVLTLVTQVEVSNNDPAFSNPQKPVGPYYSKTEAGQIAADKGWQFNEDPRGRGWRRVVPSPKPIDVHNWEIVEQLAKQGHIVITVGGGGIPVYKNDSTGIFQGVEAVIDKDLASALVAVKVNADAYYILTDVSNAYINFNQPNQKALEKISLDEARQYLAQGHFSEGSMAPKIRAAMYFVESGGKETVITEAGQLHNENSGTRIHL